MTPPRATVLFLEDSDLDAELVRERLGRSGLGLAVDRVADRRGFVERLTSTRYDLILCDYQVPGFGGLDALALARVEQPDAPFLFVSGTMGEELAVETLKSGATDYVLKQRLARLPAAVERALTDARLRAERRQVEQSLRESEARVRLSAVAAGVGYGSWDLPTGRFDFDAQTAALFGVGLTGDAAEAFGRIHADDRPRVEAAVAAAAGGDRYQVEFRVAQSDGPPRWLHSTGSVVCDGAGRPAQAVGAIFDIDDRKRAEAELRDADRRKDEFLATLAHELRNPLAPLRTGLAVLRANPSAPPPPRTLAMMERQVGHMVRLIDDLLDHSRVSSGKVELRRDRVELRTAVEYAVETSRPVVEAGGHDLSVSLPDAPLWLDADLTRLAQVVGNLLTNSAKYTPPGGLIALAACRDGSEAVVTVTDSGVGIPAEMLGQVFEMFTQVGAHLDRSQGGLGIGLALVRQLVALHGGSVSASSPGPGLGSTFTLRLPTLDAAPGLAVPVATELSLPPLPAG